jgi:hypothetical protein
MRRLSSVVPPAVIQYLSLSIRTVTNEKAKPQAETLAGLMDEAGNLEQDFRIEWPVQSVRLSPDGEYLQTRRRQNDRMVRPGKGLLREFMRLGEHAARPEHFLEYASRWGVLGLCHHGHVHTHKGMLPRCALDVCETIQRWRYYARMAAAIVAVAAAEHLDRVASDTDVIVLAGLGEFPAEWKKLAPHLMRGLQRLSIRLRVNEWLRESSIQPLLWWDGTNASLRLGFDEGTEVGATLFGAIGMELAAVVRQQDSVFTCDGCGRFFAKGLRRPKRGQRSFCPKCRRDKVPMHMGQRDFSRRRKERQSQVSSSK